MKSQTKNVVMNEDTLRMIKQIRQAILGDSQMGVRISDSQIIRKAVETFYYDLGIIAHNCTKQGNDTAPNGATTETQS